MSNSDLTSILFILLLLVGLAQLLGYFFVKLRQPRWSAKSWPASYWARL